MLETVLIPDVFTRTTQRTKRQADEIASLAIAVALFALLVCV